MSKQQAQPKAVRSTGPTKKELELTAKAVKEQRGKSALRTASLIVASVALAVMTMFMYADNFRVLTVLICITAAAALVYKGFGRRLDQRLSPAVAALAVYVIFTGVSVIWALCGKFFLREYAKLLVAFAVYILVLICTGKTRSAVRYVCLLISGACALFAFFSVDVASSGIFTAWIYGIKNYLQIDGTFEAGTRLTGIFGNANILAGSLGIGILLSVYLAEDSENRWQRAVSVVLMSLSAYAFLLAFSMGATAMLLLSVVFYLVFAGKKRGAVLLRLLQVAVPTVVFVFLAFPYFTTVGSWIPTLLLLLNAAVSVALELFIYEKAASLLERHARATGVLLGAVAALIIIYAAAGLTMTGTYDLGAGEYLERAAYPSAGENSLIVDSDGAVNVTVESQDATQVMMHTRTTLYSGDSAAASFTVPDGSKVVYVTFNSANGAAVKNAAFSSGEKLPLDYKLLPGFIANRLQGLKANENAIQRTVFFRDGIKLFKLSPIGGSGMGACEGASDGVKDFYYTTKYIHNNYIQVLADGGIIGFVCYMAFLLLTAWVLIRSARRDKGQFVAIYPALWACFVFLCGHSAVEVTFSTFVVLPTAYAVFALIALCFGSADTIDNKKTVSAQVCRWGACALFAVFALLITGNIAAVKVVNNNRTSYTRLYSALDSAMKLDIFERDDYVLSYINSAPAQSAPEIKEKASSLADGLMDRRSNTNQAYLITYYLSCSDYEKAEEAALKFAEFNRSNPDAWNRSITLLAEGLTPEGGTLDEAGSAAIIGSIANVYARLQAVNTELWQPVTLSDANVQLLSTLGITA